MSNVVWKFQIVSAYETIPCTRSVGFPMGAKILSVGIQQNGIYVWAQVDESALEKQGIVIRNFEIYGTGQRFADTTAYKRTFIGTVFDASGDVFHIYEII